MPLATLANQIESLLFSPILSTRSARPASNRARRHPIASLRARRGPPPSCLSPRRPRPSRCGRRWPPPSHRVVGCRRSLPSRRVGQCPMPSSRGRHRPRPSIAGVADHRPPFARAAIPVTAARHLPIGLVALHLLGYNVLPHGASSRSHPHRPNSSISRSHQPTIRGCDCWSCWSSMSHLRAELSVVAAMVAPVGARGPSPQRWLPVPNLLSPYPYCLLIGFYLLFLFFVWLASCTVAYGNEIMVYLCSCSGGS